MANDERRNVNVRVHTGNGYDLDGTLAGAVAMLTRIMNDIPEEYRDSATVDFSCYEEYGGATSELTISYWRPETDEEMADRNALYARRAREIEERERAILQALKQKYA